MAMVLRNVAIYVIFKEEHHRDKFIKLHGDKWIYFIDDRKFGTCQLFLFGCNELDDRKFVTLLVEEIENND